MVFSSFTFLIFFLPLVLISYFLCKNRVYRNTVLLIFSLFFYAWGEPKNIVLLLAASLAAYLGGLLMERFRDRPGLRKAVFIVTVCLLTANLFVFKYLNFTPFPSASASTPSRPCPMSSTCTGERSACRKIISISPSMSPFSPSSSPDPSSAMRPWKRRSGTGTKPWRM